MAETTIKRLVLMFTLTGGISSLVGGIRYVTKLPEFQIDGSDKPIYSCHLNFKVDCYWLINNERISIDDYDYTWMEGDGSNTYDCSIQGKFDHTPPLNNTENEVKCVGSQNGSIKVKLGGSIELQCPTTKIQECIWKRDSQDIEIDGNYTYIRNQDCSIRINRIQTIDVTEWMCFSSDTQYWSSGVLAHYTLTLQPPTNYSILNSSEVIRTEDNIAMTEILANSTDVNSSLIALTSNVQDMPDHSSIPYLMSLASCIAAGFFGGTLFIATTIWVAKSICRRTKKKNNSYINDEAGRRLIQLQPMKSPS